MRCDYCEKPVVGDKRVVILVGKGPVHTYCYEHDMLSKREFKGITLKSLTLSELHDLKEMTCIEINSRQNNDDDSVELFA